MKPDAWINKTQYLNDRLLSAIFYINQKPNDVRNSMLEEIVNLAEGVLERK